MILLDGRSLTPARVVPAERMSLQLKEKDATGSLVPADVTGIGVNSWMLDDREPHAGIVYRVRNLQQSFNSRTVTVNLEHVINTLKDRILFGDITPKEITENPNATTCTARQAIEYILSKQSDWTLNDFDYEGVSNAYKFDGDSLYDALVTVTNTLEDAEWTFDMSVYPFRLNIVEHVEGVDSELRASRNLKTISRTVDMGDMYTRFYPIGNDDLHLDSEYVERNTDLYGVISRTETDQSLKTQAELTAWANEKLAEHAQPVVTISAEGLELSRETGESLDALTVGRVCRVPLPEFDTTIQERITELSYQDKIGQPSAVKITLANSRRDVTRIIADALKKSGRGGRTAAKKDKEDLAWFEDTNDHVSMTAIGIIGVDATGKPNWTRLSQFISDGEGLHAKVETQINEATDRIATLEINEEQIRTEVASSSSSMYTVIEQTSSNITQQVTRRARVFVQIPDPALTLSNNVREGDIWIKSIRIRTWGEMAGKSWQDATEFNWNQYSGSPQFVWDGTKWEPIGDQGAVVEYGTKIDQNERMISLIARAIGAMDPTAIASIDVSAEAIQASVSSAKSELYSIIRQTSTNIIHEVADEITGISSYVEQTASSLTQAVARKNKVFIQMTDPVYNTGVTVIDGDIWIKSVANDNIKPTWSELSAKSWSSQSGTNWRDYYSGAWYVRKNNAWKMMREDADVVEIGTKLEQDEKHIALIARDVDDKHQELGSRLEVTATMIRGEVHAAKSTIYSVAEQTATNILHMVVDENAGNFSTIQQTSDSIELAVASSSTDLYGTIMVTATGVYTAVNDYVAGNYSTILQTSTNIAMAVESARDELQSSIDVQKDRISLVVSGTGRNAKIKPAAIVASINDGESTIKLSADHIDIDGLVEKLESKSIGVGALHVEGNAEFLRQVYCEYTIIAEDEISSNTGFSVGDRGLLLSDASVSGNTLTITKVDGSTVTFSKATSLSGAWSSGVFTVTASPQSQSVKTSLTVGGFTWDGRTGTAKIFATIGTSPTVYETGKTITATYPGGSGARVEIWKSDDSGQITGGNWPKSGSLSFYPWAEIDGIPYSGSVVTMTNPFTGKGNGWYCTIENLTTGGKRCRLTKEFSAGASVPFTNGSSYTLYT